MSVSQLTIQLIGFNDAQGSNFEAILNLAESSLQQQWRIAAEGQADFFVFANASLQATKLPDTPLERCLFCTGDKSAGHHIFVNADGVPSLRSLVMVLNRQEVTRPLLSVQLPANAGKNPSTQANIAAATPPSPANNHLPVASAVFYPDQGLLKALLDAKSADGPANITVDTIKLWIDPVLGVYYSSYALENLVSYCQSDSSIVITPLTPAELQRTVSQEHIAPHPLSDIIWYAAFKASQGRLLHGNSPDDIVNLLHWPNFKLPECNNYVRLAAFMHSNSLPLAEVALSIKIPLTEVYDFYNACYLLGLVEKCPAVQLHEKPLNVGRQSLLEKIRNRLK